jgi:hypothetical protein
MKFRSWHAVGYPGQAVGLIVIAPKKRSSSKIYESLASLHFLVKPVLVRKPDRVDVLSVGRPGEPKMHCITGL